jgi:hypothetical protein
MATKLITLCWLLAAVLPLALGNEWSDFRTHYNLNALNGFFKMGRTEAEAEGWTKINTVCESAGDGNSFAGFRYENPEDEGVVLIFDVNGIIAGIQARMAHDSILSDGPLNPFRYDLVPMFQNITENDKTYFILTAYFVQPEIICTVGRNETDLETEGTGTGLWFQNGPTPTDLILVSKNRTEAINDGWTKNSCFPGMGSHNFFAVETYESKNCTESQPTFLLFNKQDELQGFGFTVTGNAESKYFEHPPNAAISIILGEPVPQCVLDSNTLLGTTTMHVYFVPQPWLIGC